MSKLTWDNIGEKIAETGVDQGVLFPFESGSYTTGVAWNGLTSVNEAPTGAEANPFYADNHKYLEIMSEEEYAGSIGCYTYPDEFKPCIGEVALVPGVTVGQQTHKLFGFSYRTKVVNDTDGVDYGYKIHLVYNALAGVSARDHTTMNDSPELEEISYDFTTTKVKVTGGKPTSHLIIDSTKIPVESEDKFQTFLDKLYGKDGDTPITPTLLMPDEIAEIFKSDESDTPKLTALAINGETLTPEFSSEILEYTVSTTNNSGTLSFTKSPSTANVTVKLNAVTVTDMELTWVSGSNTVLISVEDNDVTVDYTINVTKN